MTVGTTSRHPRLVVPMDSARKRAAAKKDGAAAQQSADKSRGAGGGGAASLNPDNNNQGRSLSLYQGGYRAFPASLDALSVTEPPPAPPVVAKFAASGQGGPPPSRAASLGNVYFLCRHISNEEDRKMLMLSPSGLCGLAHWTLVVALPSSHATGQGAGGRLCRSFAGPRQASKRRS